MLRSCGDLTTPAGVTATADSAAGSLALTVPGGPVKQLDIVRSVGDMPGIETNFGMRSKIWVFYIGTK